MHSMYMYIDKHNINQTHTHAHTRFYVFLLFCFFIERYVFLKKASNKSNNIAKHYGDIVRFSTTVIVTKECRILTKGAMPFSIYPVTVRGRSN